MGDKFWRIVDAAGTQSGEAEVEFFGPISETSWLGDEITPREFKDELYAAGKGGPVTIKVNSPGGEVFAAATIRGILQDYPGKVTADILGLAASAATVVVSGAKMVRMRSTAMFMVHDPSTIAWGTIAEMEKIVEMLKQVKESIINGYQEKTGKGREELAEMMSAETWMTAEQAKAAGFVDEIVSGGEKPRMGKAARAMFLNYRNAPEEIFHEFTRMDTNEEELSVEGEASAPEAGVQRELSEDERQFRNHVRNLLGKDVIDDD